MMELRELPDRLYDRFARVGLALSNATRLRIMNLLAQTERSVDDLAERLDQSTANTSAHLKVLREAYLVDSRREGRRVYYRLASDGALRLWLSLRDMGMAELPEVREALRTWTSAPETLSPVAGAELVERARTGELVLLDLRPPEEYAAGHMPEARSVPFAELERWIDELPRDRTIVAYCRGPYCVAAIEAVGTMRARGLQARWLPEGIADWRVAGLPIETV